MKKTITLDFDESYFKELIRDYLRDNLEVIVNCDQRITRDGNEELKVEVTLCLNGKHIDECSDSFYIDKESR